MNAKTKSSKVLLNLSAILPFFSLNSNRFAGRGELGLGLGPGLGLSVGVGLDLRLVSGPRSGVRKGRDRDRIV